MKLAVTTNNTYGLTGAEASLEPADADARYHQMELCSPKRQAPKGFECASVTSENGNHYWALVAQEPGTARLFRMLPVQGLYLSYSREHKQWGGGGVISLSDVVPSSLAKALPTLGLWVKVNTSPFGIAGVRASDSDLNAQFGPLVLEHLELNFQGGPPLEAGGDFGLSLKEGVETAIGIDAGGEYRAGEKSGWDIRLKGHLDFAKQIGAGGFFEYDNRDDAQKLFLGGSFSKSWAVIELTLGFSGGIELNPFHYQVTGDASLSALGLAGLSGHGILSDAGVGACAEVHLVVYTGEIGARMFWHKGWEFHGCDFSGLYTVGAVASGAANTGRVFTIPRGEVREEFVAVGKSGPPSVTLVGPHGETVSTPSEPDKLTSNKLGTALAIPGADSTDFFLMRPAGGRWRIIPAPGSPAPFRYERADPLAPLRMKARVLGHGRERKLVWRYPAQHGVSVRFVQAGGLAEDVPHTTGTSGRRTFSIAPGPGGARKIVAYVYVEGFPLKSVVVARFTAPPPVLPRTAHASYRIRHGMLSVTWARVPHADHYEVEVRPGTSLLRYRIPGSQLRVSIHVANGRSTPHITITTFARGLTGSPVMARPSRSARPLR